MHDEHILPRPGIRAYMIAWNALSKEAYAREGVPVLEKAIELKATNKPDEAIMLLETESRRLAQPELMVAAGIMLQEAGKEKDLSKYFATEHQFWSDYVQGDQ